jgi:hypothetical protein
VEKRAREKKSSVEENSPPIFLGESRKVKLLPDELEKLKALYHPQGSVDWSYRLVAAIDKADSWLDSNTKAARAALKDRPTMYATLRKGSTFWQDVMDRPFNSEQSRDFAQTRTAELARIGAEIQSTTTGAENETDEIELL